jgi:hypothetical protein
MEICTVEAAKVMIGDLIDSLDHNDPYQMYIAYYLMPVECSVCSCCLTGLEYIESPAGSKDWVLEASDIMRLKGWFVPQLDDNSIFSITAKCPKCHGQWGRVSHCNIASC